MSEESRRKYTGGGQFKGGGKSPICKISVTGRCMSWKVCWNESTDTGYNGRRLDVNSEYPRSMARQVPTEARTALGTSRYTPNIV